MAATSATSHEVVTRVQNSSFASSHTNIRKDTEFSPVVRHELDAMEDKFDRQLRQLNLKHDQVMEVVMKEPEPQHAAVDAVECRMSELSGAVRALQEELTQMARRSDAAEARIKKWRGSFELEVKATLLELKREIALMSGESRGFKEGLEVCLSHGGCNSNHHDVGSTLVPVMTPGSSPSRAITPNHGTGALTPRTGEAAAWHAAFQKELREDVADLRAELLQRAASQEDRGRVEAETALKSIQELHSQVLEERTSSGTRQVLLEQRVTQLDRKLEELFALRPRELRTAPDCPTRAEVEKLVSGRVEAVLAQQGHEHHQPSITHISTSNTNISTSSSRAVNIGMTTVAGRDSGLDAPRGSADDISKIGALAGEAAASRQRIDTLAVQIEMINSRLDEVKGRGPDQHAFEALARKVGSMEQQLAAETQFSPAPGGPGVASRGVSRGVDLGPARFDIGSPGTVQSPREPAAALQTSAESAAALADRLADSLRSARRLGVEGGVEGDSAAVEGPSSTLHGRAVDADLEAIRNDQRNLYLMVAEMADIYKGMGSTGVSPRGEPDEAAARNKSVVSAMTKATALSAEAVNMLTDRVEDFQSALGELSEAIMDVRQSQSSLEDRVHSCERAAADAPASRDLVFNLPPTEPAAATATPTPTPASEPVSRNLVFEEDQHNRVQFPQAGPTKEEVAASVSMVPGLHTRLAMVEENLELQREQSVNLATLHGNLAKTIMDPSRDQGIQSVLGELSEAIVEVRRSQSGLEERMQSCEKAAAGAPASRDLVFPPPPAEPVARTAAPPSFFDGAQHNFVLPETEAGPTKEELYSRLAMVEENLELQREQSVNLATLHGNLAKTIMDPSRDQGIQSVLGELSEAIVEVRRSQSGLEERVQSCEKAAAGAPASRDLVFPPPPTEPVARTGAPPLAPVSRDLVFEEDHPNHAPEAEAGPTKDELHSRLAMVEESLELQREQSVNLATLHGNLAKTIMVPRRDEALAARVDAFEGTLRDQCLQTASLASAQGELARRLDASRHASEGAIQDHSAKLDTLHGELARSLEGQCAKLATMQGELSRRLEDTKQACEGALHEQCLQTAKMSGVQGDLARSLEATKRHCEENLVKRAEVAEMVRVAAQSNELKERVERCCVEMQQVREEHERLAAAMSDTTRKAPLEEDLRKHRDLFTELGSRVENVHSELKQHREEMGKLADSHSELCSKSPKQADIVRVQAQTSELTSRVERLEIEARGVGAQITESFDARVKASEGDMRREVKSTEARCMKELSNLATLCDDHRCLAEESLAEMGGRVDGVEKEHRRLESDCVNEIDGRVANLDRKIHSEIEERITMCQRDVQHALTEHFSETSNRIAWCEQELRGDMKSRTSRLESTLNNLRHDLAALASTPRTMDSTMGREPSDFAGNQAAASPFEIPVEPVALVAESAMEQQPQRFDDTALEAWYEQATRGKAGMPMKFSEAAEVMHAFFRKCDRDSNMTISKTEFLAGLPGSDDAKKLLGLPDAFQPKELDELWQTMDTDQSGELSYEEVFHHYVAYWQARAEAAERQVEVKHTSVLRDMRDANSAEGNAPRGAAAEQDADEPVQLIMREWSVSSRQLYDDNLQMFDENLLKAEKASGLLKKQNYHSIKGRANIQAIFEALPKIAEAIDRLNRGVGGTHDFLYAAFACSDRIKRLKMLISGGEDFDATPVNWSVLLLMKQDPENAGEQAHIKIVNRIVKLYAAVTTIIYDYRGIRTTSYKVRTVEESGINYQPNVALASLQQARITRSLSGQSKQVFDSNIALLDQNMQVAQNLTRLLMRESDEQRNGMKGRRQSLELFEHVAKVREAMEHLTLGGHEFLVSAFGGTSTRVARLRDLLTGGSSLDEPPAGGILRLMLDCPENFGHAANQKIIASLQKSFRAAAGAAADCPKESHACGAASDLEQSFAAAGLAAGELHTVSHQSVHSAQHQSCKFVASSSISMAQVEKECSINVTSFHASSLVKESDTVVVDADYTQATVHD